MRLHALRALSFLAIAASWVPMPSALAHDRTKPVVAGDLKIEKIWARATPKAATVAAGYVMISNKGDTADRLIGAETSIAGSTQFHDSRDDGGVTTMSPIETGIEIPSGGRAVLRPGAGHPHVMFLALRDPIKAGKPFAVTLVFERAGKVEVTFRAVAIGESPAHAGH